MNYSKMSSQYKRSNIETAGKLDLIIMCYDHAILFLKQAKNDIENKDYYKKGQRIKKVLGIINELQSCLDMEKGGLIARNLDSIYSYMTNRIVVADIHKNTSGFTECIGILEELKGAWVEISQTQRTEQPPVPVRNYDSASMERMAASA